VADLEEAKRLAAEFRKRKDVSSISR